MSWSVEVTRTDGTVERVDNVEIEDISDGVLTLSRYRSYSGRREHLGSWPLVNVAKWQMVSP